MGLELKPSMAPRQAKFVLVGFVSVILLILLINSKVSEKLWQNDQINEGLLTVKSRIEKAGIFANEIRKAWNKDQKTQRNTLRNPTTEENLTFKILIKDPLTCFMTYKEDEEQTNFFDFLTPTDISVSKIKLSFFNALATFNEIMSSLSIHVAIIEPSVIHCLLKKKQKQLLAKRNFNLANFTGSKNIMTYGIIGDDAIKLEQSENIRRLRNSGFQPYFVQSAPASWMRENSSRPEPEKYTSHVFYSYYGWTIHVVVFQRRKTYLWNAELNSNDEMNIPKKTDLMFGKYDTAYENFTFIPLGVKWLSLSNFYIPSDPHYFLLQMLSSRFLECDLSRAVNVKNTTNSPTAHSYFSVEDFNRRAHIGLHELKKFFNPLLMNFWIFSGTMLGWYRQCDVIPYTTDVDFGAWVSEVEDLDYIIKYFQKNKNLKILERMGMLEEALEFQLRTDNLRIDVFFMYKISNGSWASGHRPSKGYYFRYYYPNFTLCSAEILQEKVQVPCETEDVIRAEYGPNWMEPVSSWYYESSIYNRGPNIFWDKERRPKAFQEY